MQYVQIDCINVYIENVFTFMFYNTDDCGIYQRSTKFLINKCLEEIF